MRVDTPGMARQAPPDVRNAILLALLLLGACDKADSPKAQAAPAAKADPAAKAEPAPVKGETYGAGVTIEEVVSIDQLLATPQAYEGKTVRVEGMVTDVCPKRGCWMDLAGTGAGQKLRFKVQDGEMTFPMEAKGATAVAQGTVAIQTLSLEESRKYAEYQAKEYGATVDPASITEPMTIVRIDGTGAVIRD